MRGKSELIECPACGGHGPLESAASVNNYNRAAIGRLGLGAIVFLAALFPGAKPQIQILLFLAAYFIIGSPVLEKALSKVAGGMVLDENFLMSLTTLGAFAIGEYSEAVAVMLFYQCGEYFQDRAVHRSRQSIRELMKIRPDYANLLSQDKVIRVNPQQVQLGEHILIKPGERIPLDGTIREGSSLLDTSALTGEARPQNARPGDTVLAGFINISGLLKVEVTKEYGKSTLARVLDLVQNAADKKAPAERFITKFARYYTPAVIAAATLLAVIPPLLTGDDFAGWFYRSLVFLVVSCPCALALSIPLSYFAGIGAASKNGILIKGGNYLEALHRVDSVVFDKTGTLTKGVFKVTGIFPAPGYSAEQLLSYAALAESYSDHPIARSVLQAFAGKVDKERIEAYEEIAGQGVRIRLDGQTILVGNRRLLAGLGIAASVPYDDNTSDCSGANHSCCDAGDDSPCSAAGGDLCNAAGTVVYVAVDDVYAGCFLVSDELKENSIKTIRDLRQTGVRKIYLLSGDRQNLADRTGRVLGLDRVWGGLLPPDKVEKMEELLPKKGQGSLVYVGDGINDAPVLARANVGIAMGRQGSAAAIEAADVVVMTDDPAKVVSAIRIAQKTRRIVWQNIFFSLGVKALILLLGALGLTSIWGAVFADVGVAFLAVLNSLRLLTTRL